MNRPRLKDIPSSPAYLVFHDSYDNGAMDIYPASSLELATKTAELNNEKLGENGVDECGIWRAYTKLPRVRVGKLYSPLQNGGK